MQLQPLAVVFLSDAHHRRRAELLWQLGQAQEGGRVLHRHVDAGRNGRVQVGRARIRHAPRRPDGGQAGAHARGARRLRRPHGDPQVAAVGVQVEEAVREGVEHELHQRQLARVGVDPALCPDLEVAEEEPREPLGFERADAQQRRGERRGVAVGVPREQRVDVKRAQRRAQDAPVGGADARGHQGAERLGKVLAAAVGVGQVLLERRWQAQRARDGGGEARRAEIVPPRVLRRQQEQEQVRVARARGRKMK